MDIAQHSKQDHHASKTVLKAFKYRLYPTPEQEAALAVQFGHSRFVWNEVLAIRQQYYQDNGGGFGYGTACDLLRWLKDQHQWLYEANAQVLQQKLKDQQDAFTRFFDRVRKGIVAAGYPKFKSKHGYQSIRYPQPPKQLFSGKTINLSKVGWVKIRLHRRLEGTVKSVTVSRMPSGKYFASILCEVEVPDVPVQGPELGVDLGLIDFATFSNEEPPEPIHKFLHQSQHKLAQLQRKLARQQRGSNRYAKTKRRIAALHDKIANQRSDQQHRLSFYLTQQYGFLVFESLNIRGMIKNRRLAKAVSNAAWGQFIEQCQHKGDWYGCDVQKIGQWYPSSKICSDCGEQKAILTLSEREWICGHCGANHDRDHNAALNILAEGKRVAGRA